jgi:hypothetical protein
VKPVWKLPPGVPKKVGVYGSIGPPWPLCIFPFGIDEPPLCESDVDPEGGVNRLPLLILGFAICCIVFKLFDSEGYFG